MQFLLICASERAAACRRLQSAILPRMRKRLGIAVLLLQLTFVVTLANARVVRVEITSRSDVSNGISFGSAGAYERIEGRIYFSVSAANPHNQRIVDLDKAVNLKNGQVEFSADFVALRPKDSKKSNGSMLLEIPNRGHSRIVALLDGGDWNAATDAGDAWLLRGGYTFVALGWQWDAVGDDALKLYAPIAKENGKTITGLLRGDLMPSKVMEDIPLGPDGLNAYFVHSYELKTTQKSDLVAQADYGGPLTAIVGRDNMVGTQFHPEKSQRLGLALIANFLKWSP